MNAFMLIFAPILVVKVALVYWLARQYVGVVALLIGATIIAFCISVWSLPDGVLHSETQQNLAAMVVAALLGLFIGEAWHRVLLWQREE